MKIQSDKQSAEVPVITGGLIWAGMTLALLFGNLKPLPE
jgi:hypothetical protein